MVGVIITGLGLVFGSFVSALVWRIHKQSAGSKTTKINKNKVDLSITKGRSVCVHCGHELAAKDLIPLFSWLWLRGKCRYCDKPIEDSPLVEIGLGVAFFISYLAWPLPLESGGQWLHFSLWLIILVGLMALLVYDLRWMLLPNRLIYPLVGIALLQRLVGVAWLDFDWQTELREVVLGALIGGGVFYVLFQVSKGRWIGGGDVKLGFLMGVIAGPTYVSVALLSAFYIAAVVILPLILIKKVSRKSRIPFGPFLIIGLFVAVLWGQELVDWYKTLSGIA